MYRSAQLKKESCISNSYRFTVCSQSGFTVRKSISLAETLEQYYWSWLADKKQSKWTRSFWYSLLHSFVQLLLSTQKCFSIPHAQKDSVCFIGANSLLFSDSTEVFCQSGSRPLQYSCSGNDVVVNYYNSQDCSGAINSTTRYPNLVGQCQNNVKHNCGSLLVTPNVVLNTVYANSNCTGAVSVRSIFNFSPNCFALSSTSLISKRNSTHWIQWAYSSTNCTGSAQSSSVALNSCYTQSMLSLVPCARNTYFDEATQECLACPANTCSDGKTSCTVCSSSPSGITKSIAMGVVAFILMTSAILL